MDAVEQVRAANMFIKRLFLKNPLLREDIWPINFTPSRNSRTGWREMTFGSLELDDVIGFPKLKKSSSIL